MQIWQAVVLGLVEGATEFLPISSTFHLIWTAKLLQIPANDFVKLFEVAIQGGAILAVLFLYGRKISTKVMVSFVPTAVVGLVLYKIIKDVFFENMFLQLGMFAGVGLLFLLFEKMPIRQNKKVVDLTYVQALVIGLIQALAVIPGVSRAGAVMLGMTGMGISREESAKYSFLLAVPTILAASAYDLWKMRSLLSGQIQNIELLVTGSVVAFFSALIVIKWLIHFLQKNTLEGFGWYRLMLATLMFLLYYREI
jgi:undecaprenyl-diphosphatase